MREIPIATAKAIGPARSPTALLTPSPCSAKVDAHWLTDCSAAPAHSIITRNSQNILSANNARTLFPFSPSATSEAIGTRANTKPFTSGITAHTSARIFQFSTPNAPKNAVESSTTPT